MESYYDTLGVGKDASKDDIKKAYRKLAMQYHPDHNKDKDAEDKFKKISEAYSVLSDDKKRQEYDMFGSRPDHFNGTNAQDIFRGFWSTFDDIFDTGIGRMFRDNGFTFQGGRYHSQKKNKDYYTNLEVDLEDIYNGNTRIIDIMGKTQCKTCGGTGGKTRTCPGCNGTGRVNHRTGVMNIFSPCRKCGGSGKIIDVLCKECGGSGMIEKKRSIQLKIPQGIHEGATLRLKGEGEVMYSDLPPGDLYITIKTKSHKRFTREGLNLRSSVSLSFIEAILGARLTFKHLDGEKVTIEVPPGTQPGQTLRVKNFGLKNTIKSGDLLVDVDVEIPKKISKKQRELLENFSLQK